MAKQTAILFKYQAYFTPVAIIVWMKFYILSESTFREAFPKAYDAIANNFFWDYHLGYGGLAGNSFNLDEFLNDGNIEAFKGVIADILASYSLSKEEIRTKVAHSEKLKEFEKEKVEKLLSDNIYFDDSFGVKEHFQVLLHALQKGSFYVLADIGIEDLEGEWFSTFETGALDFNYNMTDFMALGSRVRLTVTKYDDRFYMSTWLVKVCDYTTREEREFAVRQTYVTLEEGYLNHYYKSVEGFDFRLRSPVFDYDCNTFKTQFGNVGFIFQRK